MVSIERFGKIFGEFVRDMAKTELNYGFAANIIEKTHNKYWVYAINPRNSKTPEGYGLTVFSDGGCAKGAYRLSIEVYYDPNQLLVETFAVGEWFDDSLTCHCSSRKLVDYLDHDQGYDSPEELVEPDHSFYDALARLLREVY